MFFFRTFRATERSAVQTAAVSLGHQLNADEQNVSVAFCIFCHETSLTTVVTILHVDVYDSKFRVWIQYYPAVLSFLFLRLRSSALQKPRIFQKLFSASSNCLHPTKKNSSRITRASKNATWDERNLKNGGRGLGGIEWKGIKWKEMYRMVEKEKKIMEIEGCPLDNRSLIECFQKQHVCEQC